MTALFDLDVNHALPFLVALVEHVGDDARISLEGDLTCLDLAGIESIVMEPSPGLPMSARDPHPGFITFPLSPANDEILLRQVLPRVGIRRRIRHIQIERDGKLVFGAYDGFQHVWIDAEVADESFLEQLVQSDALHRYHKRSE